MAAAVRAARAQQVDPKGLEEVQRQLREVVKLLQTEKGASEVHREQILDALERLFAVQQTVTKEFIEAQQAANRGLIETLREQIRRA